MSQKVIQEQWYDSGLHFQCGGCGNCCTGGPGFVWISDEEVDALARLLQAPVPAVIGQYCRRIGRQLSLKEKRPNARGEYDCIFLKEVPADPGDGATVAHSKRICTVYPVRPLQCRTWPFWEGNLASPEAWKRAGERCPGVNCGRRWTKQQMEARRDATQWPE